jgi:hypothetical protein
MPTKPPTDRNGLRGTTRRGQDEPGLNFDGQRRSDNFEDRGRGSRFDINIETRPRPRVRRPPGTVAGTAAGRRGNRTAVRLPIPPAE